MPLKNRDLHGNVPDHSDTALLLIDVINDMEFDHGKMLLKHALPMAKNILALKKRARRAGVPVIYVNDNFGELLQPEENDYFVLKPKHSGFFSTTLDTLLEYLEVNRLILTGIAGNICVLFTANDAYMRDFDLVIPSDCVVSNEPQINRNALQQMKTVLKADIRPSKHVRFRKQQRTKK
jgi:nicotinamidase-related amidase